MDKWSDGATYESYVGRWSRLVARELLNWLNIPAGRRWLDVGCGTGALSQTILQAAQPSAVMGLDISEPIIAFAREQIADERASFEVSDAEELRVESDSYDAAVSGLVLNFVPDQEKMVSEMARAVVPGGVVALYVWDYADQMQMIRYFFDAAVALNPAALELDESRRFPICRPEPLAELFQGAGLRQVEARPIDVPTHFQDFDDYWSPFLSGQAPAPHYAMSLSEQDRSQLRERIRESLPIQPDGSIDLIARAWAVRGIINHGA